jgi:hypothetical protein
MSEIIAPIAVESEAPQHYYPNGMGGESVANAFGSFATADASGGECVVAHDNMITAMGNINARRVVLDVGPSEPLQPKV